MSALTKSIYLLVSIFLFSLVWQLRLQYVVLDVPSGVLQYQERKGHNFAATPEDT